MENDINSALPIRSRDDIIDERVLVKLQDGDDPNLEGSTVQVSEKKLHVRNHGKDSDGTDQEILLSQQGHLQSNGAYDATENKRPSSQGLVASDRDSSPSEQTMVKRPTAKDGADNSVCLDVSLHDETGANYTEANPLPVVPIETVGNSVDVFNESTAIAKNSSANHDYTPATSFKNLEVECSGSGLARFELQVETGVGTGVFDTVMVKFNSTANPNLKLNYGKLVAAGVIIRVEKTNLDNQAQNLYTQLTGLEC